MTGAPPRSTSGATGPPGGALSLRALGVLILVMFALTSAVGGSLAAESSYLAVTLASHIGLALGTVGVCLYASAVASRPYRVRTRAFVRIAGLCAGGATLAGTYFLLFGPSDIALAAMSGFALLGMVASALIIVFGGASAREAPGANPT